MVIYMKICYKNIGIIIVHGFGGDTKEIKPLSEKLELLGYNVSTPLLTGHTGLKNDFKKASYLDWIRDVENAYLTLKDNVDEIILIGFSMGGLLSFQVAKKYKVKGVITLNTPIYVGNFLIYLKKFIYNLVRLKFYKLTAFYKSIKRFPICAYLNFNKLLKETKKILPEIQCDILINQAIHDEVVRHKSANFLHDQINSKNKKLMFYKKSNHLIFQSEVAQDVIIDLVKYIETL